MDRDYTNVAIYFTRNEIIAWGVNQPILNGNQKREQKVNRSVHAERYAYEKLVKSPLYWKTLKRNGNITLFSLRVLRSGTISSGKCCHACRQFIDSIAKSSKICKVIES